MWFCAFLNKHDWLAHCFRSVCIKKLTATFDIYRVYIWYPYLLEQALSDDSNATMWPWPCDPEQPCQGHSAVNTQHQFYHFLQRSEFQHLTWQSVTFKFKVTWSNIEPATPMLKQNLLCFPVVHKKMPWIIYFDKFPISVKFQWTVKL